MLRHLLVCSFLAISTKYGVADRLPRGLITVSVNERLLRYFESEIGMHFADILPLINLPSNITVRGHSLLDLTFERPDIELRSRFVNNTGLSVEARTQSLTLNGTMRVRYSDTLFREGWLKIFFTNVVLEVLVTISKLDSETGWPIPSLDHCKLHIDDVVTEGHSRVSSTVSTMLYFGKKEYKLIEQLNAYASDQLCSNLRYKLNTLQGVCKTSARTDICDGSSSDGYDEKLQLETNLMNPPRFSENNIYIDIRGTFKFDGTQQRYHYGAFSYKMVQNYERDMVNVIIADALFNDLFRTLRDSGLTKVIREDSLERLPPVIKQFYQVICGLCKVEIEGDLHRDYGMDDYNFFNPKVSINRNGILIDLNVYLFLNYYFFGPKFPIVAADANVQARIKPCIKNYNHVHASASVERPTISFRNAGVVRIARYLGRQELISCIEENLPSKIQQVIDENLQHVLNKPCGLPLGSEFCGLVIPQHDIRLLDHAVMITSNLTYDLKPMLHALLNSMNAFLEDYQNLELTF